MTDSGTHKAFQRADGTVHEDQRRMGFGGFMDKLTPAVIIALLAWLCMSTMTLQQQVAVLVERGTNQTSLVNRNTSDIQGLREGQSELQREIEEVKTRR